MSRAVYKSHPGWHISWVLVARVMNFMVCYELLKPTQTQKARCNLSISFEEAIYS